MKKFAVKIKNFPFYLFQIGLLPVLMLWANNVAQIKPQSVLISLAYTCLFILAIWLLCLLIYRSQQKASLLSSVIFVLFFSFGHVYNVLKNQTIFGISVGFVKLTALFFIFFILALIFTARIKFISPDLVSTLNIVFALLILYNLGTIAVFQMKVQSPLVRPDLPVETKPKPTNQPDVYYIIFDSYARQDVMKDVLNFDNSDFINSLRQRGFYVADCSNSNYDGTLASLTSSLNYSYLDNLDSIPAENGPANPETINYFMNNQIRNDFAKLGYKFVTARGFSSFDDINDSDIYLNYRSNQKMRDTLEQIEFANLYLKTTLIRDLYELYDLNPVKYDFLPFWLYSGEETATVIGHAAYWYYQTNYLFDALEKLPDTKESYFVYAHFNAPHGPYVFDRNGSFRYTHEPADPSQYYIDTIIYLNKRILEMVDAIIANSDTPPIIVLQGDHAPHVITTGYNKHKILNAYYFPGGKDEVLYDTITPVNTFRVILREYFNFNIELLPDYFYVKLLNEHEQKPSQCVNP